MKVYSKIYLFILVLSSLFACQKVIKVDLNSQDPKFVIEALFTLDDSVHTVTITKTLNIYEGYANPTIDNAVVTITDDLGNQEQLNLVSPGKYETLNYPIDSARIYTLKVQAENKEFIATSKVPHFVKLIKITPLTIGSSLNSVIALIPERLDIANEKNYYSFTVYQNGTRLNGNNIQDDQLSDGKLMQQPIFNRKIKKGDIVDIDMFMIEPEIYKYLFTLNQNNRGATPANPTSNFSGDCFGYFAVRTKSSKQIIIPN
jgi:hypothetical protein